MKSSKIVLAIILSIVLAADPIVFILSVINQWYPVVISTVLIGLVSFITLMLAIANKTSENLPYSSYEPSDVPSQPQQSNISIDVGNLSDGRTVITDDRTGRSVYVRKQGSTIHIDDK